MLELEVKIEAKDLYDYLLMHTYNSASGVTGTAAGAVFILLAVFTGRWIFILFGILLLVYLPWTLFLKSRQQVLKNPSFQQPLHYLLDEEGLSISQGQERVQYLWDELYKAVSTGRSIIVYTSPVNATIFPKRQMEDKTADLIQIISTHMPPKKVKIRT